MRDRTDHNFAQIDHNPEDAMSALNYDMRSLARQAVDLRGGRIGASNAQQALCSVARAIRCAPGSIRNALYGRAKRIDARLLGALSALVITELQHEMNRLTHDMEMARLAGSRPDAREIQALEAELAALKAALGHQP